MELFSEPHLAALSGILVLGILLILFGRRYPDKARYLLIVGLALCFPLNLFMHFQELDGIIPLEVLIPFQVCDLVVFTSIIALVRGSKIASELTYFWALGASTQALLTPALFWNYPHPIYFQFFIHHGLIVITALFLPLSLGWKPRPCGWFRAWIALNAYTIIALILNHFLSTNFAFLAKEPPQGSLMNLLGPWPWYLLSLQPIALLTLYLLNAPFRNQSTTGTARVGSD